METANFVPGTSTDLIIRTSDEPLKGQAVEPVRLVYYYPQVAHLWKDKKWYKRYNIDEIETIAREMARQMVDSGNLEFPKHFWNLIRKKSESIQYIHARLQDLIWDLDLRYLNCVLMINDKSKPAVLRKMQRMIAKKNRLDRRASVMEQKICLDAMANLPFIVEEHILRGPTTTMANFF